jgi:GDP-L-fucose synthase
MKILVTGGNGLVGSAIKKAALKNPQFDFIFIGREDYDLTKENEVESLFLKHKPNYVIHTAAKVGGIGGNMIGHADYFYQNILINSFFIHYAWKHNVEKLLAFSSVCVFPNDSQILKEENMHNGPPFSGNFAYAYAKRMVDVQIRAYKEQHNIKNYCSIIPSNIIGTHDFYNLQHGHVLPSLMHKIYLAKKNNSDLEVWGDGKSLREFIFADDLAVALVDLLKKDNIPERLTIAGNKQNSIKEIVDMLVKASGFNGQVIFNGAKPNGQRNRQSDLSLFNTLFPNFNFTNTEDAIRISYNWFEKNYPSVRL